MRRPPVSRLQSVRALSRADRVAAGRLVLLAVLLLGGVVVAWRVGLPEQEELRRGLDGLGAWGPVLFVFLYALVTLAPLPKAVLAVAAGILFGFAGGVALVMLGAMIGAVAAFAIGRKLGREAVQRFTGSRVARLDDLLTRRGLLAVLTLRLIPVVPFTALNYSAGLTGLPLGTYVLGTAIGILPGTLAYVALGSYGTDALNEFGLRTLVAVGALTVLVVLAALRARRARAEPD